MKNNIWLINISIICVIASGILDIASGLPGNLFPLLQNPVLHHLPLEVRHGSAILSTLSGFFLLLLGWGLWKRVRNAWLIVTIILSFVALLHIFRLGIFHGESLISLALTAILLWEKDYFKKPPHPIYTRLGLYLGGFSIIFPFIYGTIGFYHLKKQFRGIENWSDSFGHTVSLITTWESTAVSPLTKEAFYFTDSVIIIGTVCLLTALWLLLRPYIVKPIITRLDRAKVRELVKKYGDNPISYLGVERDKSYFFSQQIEGVICYVQYLDVAVVAGDPICADEECPALIQEFTQYCQDQGWDICFTMLTTKYLLILEQLNYKSIKYGEEAMFNLENYSLQGSKTAKIRQARNHCLRLEIRVKEHHPLLDENENINQQIEEVSKDWLKMKKSSELSFLLGSLSLDVPWDRKYFVALSPKGRVEAFLVCLPFAQGEGYYLDMTRRRQDAPTGIMEFLVTEAFEIMKKQGIIYTSLGLAPLANLETAKNEEQNFVLRGMELIYEHLNRFYHFKPLYKYKAKYNPTSWEPRYLAYYPPYFSFKIAHAILKAQNPRGIKDFLFYQFKPKSS